jgi:hypothetical protein
MGFEHPVLSSGDRLHFGARCMGIRDRWRPLLGSAFLYDTSVTKALPLGIEPAEAQEAQQVQHSCCHGDSKARMLLPSTGFTGSLTQ